MYSVALERIEALLSLFAAAVPSSSSRSPALGDAPIPCLDAKRRPGTLSLSSDIFSFRLARYRFSIRLWDLFLEGIVFDSGRVIFAPLINMLFSLDGFRFRSTANVDINGDGKADSSSEAPSSTSIAAGEDVTGTRFLIRPRSNTGAWKSILRGKKISGRQSGRDGNVEQLFKDKGKDDSSRGESRSAGVSDWWL
jgi:hypothetical protein